MADLKKTFELAFAIGGKLDPSFKTAHSDAAAQIAALSKKSSEAMAFKKISKEHTEALNNFKSAAANMGAAWGKVVDSVVGPLKQIAAGAILAGGAAYGLATKTGQMGDSAVKSAKKIGVTTQEYSKLAYAADLSGISQEEFSGSMTKLNRLTAEAVKGNKDATLAFRRAGVSIKDANGNLKSSTQIMLEASDMFHRMPEGIYKADLAMALFGKSGANMVPLMEQGSKEINRLAANAERLGIVFSDIEGKNAEAFMDSMTDVKSAVQGLGIAVGKQLHEPLTRINQAVTEWIVNNREFIAQKVSEFIQDVTKWVKENKEGIIGLGESVKAFIGQIGKWIEKNGGLVEVLKKVAKAFLLVKGIGIAFSLMGAIASTATFIASLATLIIKTKALIAAFGGFKVIAAAIGGVAAPVAAVIAAVAALGVATYLLIKHWDDVVYFFKNLSVTVPIFINDLVEDITGIFGKLPGWLQNIISPIKNIVLGPIKAIQSLLAGDIKGFFINMGKFMMGFIATVPQMIINAGNEIIKAIFGVDILGAIKEWLSPAINIISDIFDVVIDTVKNFFTTEFNNIKEAFGNGFLDGIFEILVSVPTMFIRMGADVISAILSMDIVGAGIKWIKEFVVSIGSAIKSFFVGEFSAVKDAFGKSFFGGIAEIVNRVPSLFIRMMNDVIKAITGVDIIGTVKIMIGDLVSDVVSAVTAAFHALPGVVSSIIINIKNAFLGLFKGVLLVITKFNPYTILNAMIKKMFGIDLIAIGKRWFQGFVTGAMGVITNAGAAIKDAVGGLIPSEAVAKIRSAGASIVESIRGSLGAAWSTITDTGAAMGEAVVNFMGGIKGAFYSAWSAIKSVFSDAIASIKAAFSEGFFKGIAAIINNFNIVTLLNNIIQKIFDIDLLAKGKEWFQKFIDGAMGVITNAGAAIKDAVGGLIPKAGDLASRAINAVSKIIPKFGEGGIATEPSLVAEDGKPEAVIPLTKPRRALELLRKILPDLPGLNPIKDATVPMPAIVGNIQRAAPPKPPSAIDKAKEILPKIPGISAFIKPAPVASAPVREIASNANATASQGPSPLEKLQKTTNITNSNTKNIAGSTFSFSPTYNITATGDGGNAIKTAIEQSFDKLRSEFEDWIKDREYQMSRVAMG